jgi:DNA-binding CsgD family transcriptional regulator
MTGIEPFVGRVAELAVLRAELAFAGAGQPRVVMIEGDAGIGKSTLLNWFCADAEPAVVLRAAGEESEQLIRYGVGVQLLGGDLGDVGAEPLAIGGKLLSVVDRAQAHSGVVLLVVDDLHWVDPPSAAALLFALRRLEADRVLALVSTRPGEVSVAAGWERFVSGDPRASRIRLPGIDAGDVRELAEQLGVGSPSTAVASRLVAHTGGSPLHCRALLEELGAEGLRRAGDVRLPAPKGFGNVVLARLSELSTAAQHLVTAAAVLGVRSPLSAVAQLAEVDDPAAPLEEAVATGLLSEDGVGAGALVGFVHPLTRAAVYGDLGPLARRRLHARAAGVVAGTAALTHRVGAAAGPDELLACDLELAASEARVAGQVAQAAVWLEQAGRAAESRSERDRLLLDSLEVLVLAADIGGAFALMERIDDVSDCPWRSALVAELSLQSGQVAGLEQRLRRLWDERDPGDARTAARIALTMMAYLHISARVEEEADWATRAVAAADGDPRLTSLCRPLAAWGITWLHGREGLRGFDHLPSDPSAVPLELSDDLWVRGQARSSCDDLHGAIADLRTVATRVRAGVPIRYPSQGLAFMCDTEYRLGRWDDALLHGELAVSLSHDAERAWDYPFVHAYATFVPAARGDWELASLHADAASAATEQFGAATAVAVTATAWAALGDARGDYAAVLDAAADVRSTGRIAVFAPGIWDWQQLEIDALISTGRYDRARAALDDLERSIERRGELGSQVSAAGLRGRLAAVAGDHATADAAFADAWRFAREITMPYRVAWLGLIDGQRLHIVGRRREAIERLRTARELLVGLGARPYLERCDTELAALNVDRMADDGDPAAELTRAELAVARLVVTGSTNREVASQLFVSVKTVEFHLRHVYQKLGIHSRVALVERMRERE